MSRGPISSDSVETGADSSSIERAARAAELRAFRLTRNALPPVLPTKMPPQQFEFYSLPLAGTVQRLKQLLTRRPALSRTADIGHG